ncbi:hypothetical protein KDK95_18835 [Actinospica sp. MGRD01-02]|uniref:Uncharacterized protein n=1 Tax=Actinospica acidithermotolerans TaxID=2828514 RepID=A0A941III2_9ACTN|nr:hypothetical protein [Actinospica acidithermotolerans]MBR7828374.1 hypothetical protein [Actinospica acidithermotolerans]
MTIVNLRHPAGATRDDEPVADALCVEALGVWLAALLAVLALGVGEALGDATGDDAADVASELGESSADAA